MQKIYITKVLAILGGFRDQSEYTEAVKAFEARLTPSQAVQRILNNR